MIFGKIPSDTLAYIGVVNIDEHIHCLDTDLFLNVINFVINS